MLAHHGGRFVRVRHHSRVPIRAVIFDWIRRRSGAAGADLECGVYGRRDSREVEHQVAEVRGLDETRLTALMTDVWNEYLGTLNEDLAGYFSGLRPRCKTAILSNSFVGAREREHAAYGFGEMCDLVVYSHGEGLLKPDPRFYRVACERLGVSPREVVFLDDTQGHVDGARAVGMAAVRFLDNEQAVAELENYLSGSQRLIRAARPSDAEAVAGLLAELGYPDDIPGSARLERLAGRHDAGVLVAQIAGRVAALAAYQVMDLLERRQPQCRVTTLVVHPDERRHGLASALMGRIESIDDDNLCFRLEVTTRAHRSDAMDLYLALGFRVRPRRLVKPLISS